MGGYILCQAHGGLNDITCQIWLCTIYAITHNRSIILTHWSYFKSDLFDIFDFSDYPVPVYSLSKFKSITYHAVEPEVSKDYLNCFLDKPNNFGKIGEHINLIPKTVFDKQNEYPETTLLFHDSAGGGVESIEFFKHIKFTPYMIEFYREKTLDYPSEYNALHIRNTDITTDVEPLLQTINSKFPLFIGTDDTSLKEYILKTYTNTFSSSFDIINTTNLHYTNEKYVLEWTIVDLMYMVFSQNTIESTYSIANIPVVSGFTRLIDLLKTIKSKMYKKLHIHTTHRMVFTSAGDNTNFDELWVNYKQTYDIYVIYFGDDEDIFEKYKSKVHYAEKRKGSKFQNFSYFYKNFNDVIRSYDYIFILDDDIIISSQDIETMFTIAEKYYLLICQPSFTKESQISHSITKHIPTVYLQYTNFVEVNAMLFKREALDRLMNKYDDKLIGWGIDYLSIYENGITLTNKYAVIHEVQCTNPHISNKKYKRKELEFVYDCNNRERLWLEFAEQNNYLPCYKLKSYDTIYTNSYDIWVINLYNKHNRWNSFSGLNVNRFNAIDGNIIQIDDAIKDGISPLIMLKTDSTKDIYYTKTHIENNQGKVGCWLSHKRLLQHLLNVEHSDSHIHLIIEDDVCLDDLYKWKQLYPTIPSDWDIVYAGIVDPILTNSVNSNVYRGVTAYPSKNNLGSHAYFVKHGSIPNILKHLEFMTHEIDVQLDIMFSKMNVYIIDPPIVTLNNNSIASSIETHNIYTTWETYLLSIIETPLNRIKFDTIADLECFARIFAGTSPWLAVNNDGLQILGNFKKLVAAENIFTQEQSIVECAYICYGFLVTKNVLWEQLSGNIQKQFITILQNVRKLIQYYHTECNWCLFHGIIEVFLKSINEAHDSMFIFNVIKTVESWYCGDGFYKDGVRGFTMDYYNSYVIHPFYIEILKICNPSMVDKAFERCIKYTEFLERIVSPDGSYPPLGRSITYRFGVFHTLAYCIYNQRISSLHTYAQLQRLLTNVLKRIITSSIFNADGILEIGFTGSQPEIGDWYSNWGSCYLTTLGFLPLGLDRSHEFWIDSNKDYYSQELAWVYNMPFKKHVI